MLDIIFIVFECNLYVLCPADPEDCSESSVEYMYEVLYAVFLLHWCTAAHENLRFLQVKQNLSR